MKVSIIVPETVRYELNIRGCWVLNFNSWKSSVHSVWIVKGWRLKPQLCWTPSHQIAGVRSFQFWSFKGLDTDPVPAVIPTLPVWDEQTDSETKASKVNDWEGRYDSYLIKVENLLLSYVITTEIRQRGGGGANQ